LQNRRSGEKPGPGSLIVGVTGGIGSGKSAVCREFERLGRSVLSADRIARELTETDGKIQEEIRAAFGTSVFSTDGDLKRRDLAEIVFHDPDLRQKLNAIVHPRVFSRIDEMLSRLPPTSRHPYVVIEAALIFETDMDKRLDYTIVVDAPEEIRIKRVMQRDGCSREEVVARTAAQMSVHRKREKADFVLDNSDAASSLVNRVAFLDRLFTIMISGGAPPAVKIA